MKLLIEEYQYPVSDVTDVLEGLFNLQDVEQKVSVSYVGYYYNPNERVKDIVFILPKVLIDENNKVFGKYTPEDLIHLDEAKIDENEKKFLYEFSVWIHRAIVVFNQSNQENKIVLHRQIESEGKGNKKKKSNTLLDVILSLIFFNKENQQFLTFIIKNIHSGLNNINWGKTISSSTPMVHGNNPVYLNPVNKKKMINFDEELIIIFFSILHYVSDRYGFRTKIPFGFTLLKGKHFERYLNGYGRTRLKQIKYKYFSDTAVKLWDLCYAFFEKSYQIRMNVSQSEYLLVKSFHIVFEAMIDELIGTPHNQLPEGLAEQYDGKIVDHLYTYEGILVNQKEDDDIYYIGDSKYYKIGNSLGKESIYKQRTYARNVIQWNMNLWLDNKADKNDPFEKIQLFDKMTEGYNVIPNFFISADIDMKNLSYEDRLDPKRTDYDISRQFKNRLYDRDTLLLSHYNVNFLFVLALYARNNSSAKLAWKAGVRKKFRTAVQTMLKEKFEFYALSAHPDVNAEQYFKEHFQETLGKTYRPYDNKKIYSLALDKNFTDENEELKKKLTENFYVVPITLGEEPSEKLELEKSGKGKLSSPDGMGMFLFGIIFKFRQESDGVKIMTKEYLEFSNFEGKEYVLKTLPKGDISKIKYFVPLFDGGIRGYYEITSYNLKTKSKPLKDKVGNPILDEEGKTIEIPDTRLKLNLGAYIPLGEYVAEVANLDKRNGQIHNYQEILSLYRKE